MTSILRPGVPTVEQCLEWGYTVANAQASVCLLNTLVRDIGTIRPSKAKLIKWLNESNLGTSTDAKSLITQTYRRMRLRDLARIVDGISTRKHNGHLLSSCYSYDLKTMTVVKFHWGAGPLVPKA